MNEENYIFDLETQTLKIKNEGVFKQLDTINRVKKTLDKLEFLIRAKIEIK